MTLHHHGADGSCHSGPGGLFGCPDCDTTLDDSETDEREDDPE